jgi:hypothetical protein
MALDKLAELLGTRNKDLQARDLLIELGKKVLKAANAPTEIGVGPIKYDILHKLTEEINCLPYGMAEKILSEIKALLSQWP